MPNCHKLTQPKELNVNLAPRMSVHFTVCSSSTGNPVLCYRFSLLSRERV